MPSTGMKIPVFITKKHQTKLQMLVMLFKEVISVILMTLGGLFIVTLVFDLFGCYSGFNLFMNAIYGTGTLILKVLGLS